MSIEDMLKGLREEYLQELPEKISDIEMVIESEDREDLHQCFHKLKGTGMTYGIPEISTLCASVEEIIEKDFDQGLKSSQVATMLLRKIHDSRVKGQPFDLETDLDFQKILSQTQ